MKINISRRAVLGAAAVVPVAVGLQSTHARAAAAVNFTLNAKVLVSGEQVTSVTLHTSDINPIDAASLSASTFSVHALATRPVGLTPGTTFNGPREVTGVSLDNRGNIVLDLKHGFGVAGADTLTYSGRNWRLDLAYTITQAAPIALKNGRSVTIDQFVQGELSSPEVDSYIHGEAGGLLYRLFRPTQGGGKERATGQGKRPLIVWLHGGGEGGNVNAQDNNEGQLRANRGALGFSTDEAQRIFKGAYVLAPQSPSAWMRNGNLFAPQIKAVIDDVVARYPVDPARIHVLGCSNGGYMSLKMAVAYPDTFASIVPICPGATPNYFSDAELSSVSTTPTWLVHAKNDTTLRWEPNTGRASALIEGSIVSLYDDVTWQGVSYPGHWSWIYVGENDPQHNGQHIMQWMAQQKL